MKLSIDKKDLLGGLNTVQRAVGADKLNPILGCVLLNTLEGGIQLTGTNLELAVRTSVIPADVSVQGVIALEAKLFLDMVKRLPDGVVEISVDSKGFAGIKCQKASFRLAGDNPDEFPIFPEVSKDSGVLINGEILSSMIRQTVFAVSDNPDKPTLNGQLVKIEGGSVEIVAIDGFRVAYRHSAIPGAELSASAIVPGDSMAEICRLISANSGDVTVYFTDKHILFELDTCTVVSRLIEGEFINYKTILGVLGALPVKADRCEMLSCLERASLVLSEDMRKQPVKFAIERDAITVTSFGAKSAIHEDIGVETDIEDLSLILNPKYLIEALKAIDDDEIVIRFAGEMSPFVAEPVAEGNYKYLIMPLSPRAYKGSGVDG